MSSTDIGSGKKRRLPSAPPIESVEATAAMAIAEEPSAAKPVIADKGSKLRKQLAKALKQRDEARQTAARVERDFKAIWAAQREELDELRAKVASLEGRPAKEEGRDAVLRELRPPPEHTLEQMVATLQRGDAHLLRAFRETLTALLDSPMFPDFCELVEANL